MIKKYNQQESNSWLILITTSLGTLLVLLNFSSLNVALPAISQYFHTDAGISNWILLSYMIVNTVFILIFGPFADIYGRKKLFMLALYIFSGASLLIGFSPNIWCLLILRVLQALGGALFMANNTALLTDHFPKQTLAIALGINVLVASLGQMLGPVIGGFLVTYCGWRWVFWFNVPFGIMSIIIGLFVINQSDIFETKQKIDVWGSVFIFLSLGGLIFALSEYSILGITNIFVILGFSFCLVFTPLFILTEKKSSSPMLDFSLFHNRFYVIANITTFLNFFSQTAVVLLFSLIFQLTFKDSAFIAGLKVIPVTLGMLIASPISGILAKKYPLGLLSSVGLSISSAGLCILFIGIQAPYIVLFISMFAAGIGSGLFLTPNTTIIMTNVPADRRGAANGLRAMLNNMGQVVSTAVALSVATAVLPQQLKNVLYEGASASIGQNDMHYVFAACRLSIFVLFVATTTSAILSFSRIRKQQEYPEKMEIKFKETHQKL